MELIDKDALVVGIEDWRDKIIKSISDIPLTGRDRADATFEYEILGEVKSFLNFFIVKEVDLEKELELFFYPHVPWGDYSYNERENIAEWSLKIAKHFFEFGLKAQKRNKL